MRKGGKTAPAWAKNSCSMRKKLLQHAQRWENSPRMGKKTLAACAKNSCSMGTKLLQHMRTKIEASSELLIVEFGGSEDNFL